MTAFYGTVADFKTYHVDRGRVVSDLWDDSVIQSALLIASEWLDDTYDSYWYGYATGGYTQERRWPRSSAYTNNTPSYVFGINEIPQQVINATYEAAFREATSQGSLSVDFTPLKYKSVRIDGAISVDFAIANGASDTQLEIPIISRLMNILIDSSRSSSSYSGASVRS
jgi:hypothetical protein